MASKHFTELINTAAERDPAAVESFMTTGKAYFSELEQHGLKDWLVDPEQNQTLSATRISIRSVLRVLGWPLYALGMLGHYLPYRLATTLTKKIVKNKEFYSSFFLGVAMVIFLLNYILWFTVIYSLSPNIGWPLLACLVLALSAWFSLHYDTFQRKTRGMRRIWKNKALLARLAEKRNELMQLVNKF
jgi:hypothetical protein